jgi:SAM-dependent methyltransferase
MRGTGMSLIVAPEYGVSDHYIGVKGRDYFAWQNGGALFAGRISSHKFRHLVKANDTVLDFGCGGGGLLYNLNCAKRIGIEINPLGRDHAAGLGIECHATLDDVPDGVVDVAVSDHALEHVPFPIGALRQLRAKLKPTGVLSVCVPSDNWRHQQRYDPADIHHHLHTWTPLLLGNSLYEAGFEVLSVFGRIHAWPRKWTVAAYGRLPLWLFNSVCYVNGVMKGKGREVLAIATPVRGQTEPLGGADLRDDKRGWRHEPARR